MPRVRVATAQRNRVVNMGKFRPETAKENAQRMKRPVEGQPVCPVCRCAARTSKAGWSDAELGITKDTRLFSAHARGGMRLKPGEFPCPGSYRVADKPQTPI